MSRASLIGWTSGAVLSVALCLSAGALASKRAAGTPTLVPQGFVGMVIDEPVWPDPFVQLPQQLDAMVASGVQTVRVVFDWATTQPYKTWSEVPSGELSEFVDVGGIPTNLYSIDQLGGRASQRGLTVLPTILGAPSWDGQTYKGGIVALPKSTAPYAAFANALVLRYGPSGSLRL